MRRRIAVIIGTCLVAQLALASTPASAGSRIQAREVVGGLSQPVAFTFGPGKKIWYVEKSTGQVRIHDLDTDADRLFVTVPGVNGDGERGMLGIALHPNYPDKPLVYVYATRSAGGGLRNQILRYRTPRLRRPAARCCCRPPRAAARTTTAGGSCSGRTGCSTRSSATAHDSSNAQDLTDDDRGKILRIDPDGDVPSRQPVRRPRLGVRASATRSGSRSTRRPTTCGRPRTAPSATTRSTGSAAARTTAGDRTRPAAAPPRQHEPGRPEPRPARALLREHDRHHRHRVLRRVPPRPPAATAPRSPAP